MKGLRFDDGRVGSKWEEDDSGRDEILVHVTSGSDAEQFKN